jgi:hypothetical protein
MMVMIIIMIMLVIVATVIKSYFRVHLALVRQNRVSTV